MTLTGNTKFLSVICLSTLILLVSVTCLPQKPVEHKGQACQNYFNDCNPWHDTCCKGLRCLNVRKGWCAGLPFERCVCQDKDVFNIQKKGIW